MKILLLLTAIVVLVQASNELQEQIVQDVPEDAKLTVPELIQKYGYPVEIHTVTTSDGYILEMHRIPHGKNGPTGKERPVLVQHGILCSSADFVISGPDNALAYALADAGYDVWLANSRGTRYSRKHVSLDPDKDAAKFWDFSWHEIGIYDLPAQIDEIIQQTKQEQIFYIGHSQGTTVYYVLLSEIPQYKEKVIVMFSLAPMAYMKHVISPIIRLSALWQPTLAPLYRLFGLHEFLPHNELLAIVTEILCGDDSEVQVLCTNALFAVAGFNRAQINSSLIPVIAGHTPAGASTKQILHYGQLVRSGKFCLYDYGVKKNLKRYGTILPPNYKLENVVTEIYIYYSRNDWISSYKDVSKLANKLPNLKGKFLIADGKFNHIDYLYAIEARSLIYDKLIRHMQLY